MHIDLSIYKAWRQNQIFSCTYADLLISLIKLKTAALKIKLTCNFP